MTGMPTPDGAQFQEFAAKVSSPAFVAEVAQRVRWSDEEMSSRLSLALGEAAQTLRLLAGADIPRSARLIEIGAGLGLVSAFVSSTGYEVVALEPAGIGFDAHRLLVGAIASALGSTHEVLTIEAAALDRQTHGAFDLVFSHNVLEHVADVGAALHALADALTAGGLMVHSCPNYTVPFEPHFGIPLLPVRPAATRRLLPSSIADSELWWSLNFVTAREVESIIGDTELELGFRSGALAASVERLASDEEFRLRHPVLARVAGGRASAGAARVLRRLPARWSTPMDFAVSDDLSRIAAWQSG